VSSSPFSSLASRCPFLRSRSRRARVRHVCVGLVAVSQFAASVDLAALGGSLLGLVARNPRGIRQVCWRHSASGRLYLCSFSSGKRSGSLGRNPCCLGEPCSLLRHKRDASMRIANRDSVRGRARATIVFVASSQSSSGWDVRVAVAEPLGRLNRLETASVLERPGGTRYRGGIASPRRPGIRRPRGCTA